MSLRPRYSLLTLLVLTALIAGGVKLWYGPHHVIFTDPLSSAQKLLLKPFENDGHNGLLFRNELTFRYEVEYLREWEGMHVLSFKFIPLQEITLASGPSDTALIDRNFKGCKLLVMPWMLHDSKLEAELKNGSHERVLCLLHRGRYGWPNPLYALTEQKKIYELVYMGVYIWFAEKPVTIDQVVDADLRAKIKSELAKIPDPH